MAHYAKVTNSIVQQVIVAEAEFVENLEDNIAGRWVQTSYNTYGGQHRLGGTPLRKNFAGVGMTYDANRDAFIPQKPDGNYRLNEDTCLWELVE
jgi:hypothetical protein